jgi:hypothetical protein
MVSMASTTGAQSDLHFLEDADSFWTLPVECYGENVCEIRISSNGTIYNWDINDFKLYISRKNIASYEAYDLGQYSQDLVFSLDFVPFDELGYIIFYSPIGSGRMLNRYNINAGTLQLIQFPENYDLVGCNLANASVRQLRLRHIYPLGINSDLMACTNSPQNRPVMHIIDVTSLTIRKTLDIQGGYVSVFQPGWIVSGGINGKIYAIVHNPEATIGILPQINETSEEFVLVYDVSTETWTYEIKPIQNTYEILAVLPDGTLLFQNYTIDGREIIQFTPKFKILRRFGLEIGVFLGVTSNGDIFFSTGDSDTGILIENINDYQMLLPAPIVNAGSDQAVTDADNSGSESVTLDGSASTDADGTIVSYVWTLDGTEIATDVAPTVNLPVGTHVITLTVTDDDGLKAYDEVTIMIEAPPPTPIPSPTPSYAASIVRFELLNPANNAALMSVTGDATINLAAFNVTSVRVQAVTSPGRTSPLSRELGH